MDHVTVLDTLSELIRVLKKYELDIRRALLYGGNTQTYDEVCAKVISGDLEVFELNRSIIITETTRHSTFSVFHIFIAGGDLEEILASQDMLISEAKLRGCKYLSMSGRKGWERPLTAQGWNHKLSIMHMEVPDE